MSAWHPLEAVARRIRVARATRAARIRSRGTPAAHAGVFGRIHPADLMIRAPTPEQLAAYVRIGKSGYTLIEDALALLNRRPAEVERLLDFGCGYGRVVRELVQHVTPERVSAFDVDPAAARFCATEFRVRGLAFERPWDWRSVAFESYDVIFAGSVFTHLAQGFAREMLSLLHSILKPGGLLVATILGDEALARIPTGYFGPRLQALEEATRASYAKADYCFIPLEPDELAILPFQYERAQEFGYTWASQRFLADLVIAACGDRLRVLSFAPAGWEHVHDVVVWQREPQP